MIIKTESDGEYTTIEIEDSGKHFEYRIDIRNNADGSCAVWYENSTGDTWQLLNVDKSGAITIEEPTKD